MRNIRPILAKVCGPYVSDPSLKLPLMDPADILFAANGISINHSINFMMDPFLLQDLLVVTELETK